MSDPFVTIVLPGPPRGKGRPRTRVIGEFATIFTDKKTRNYENDLKAAGIKAMAGRPHLDEPVSVMVLAFMPVSESWSQKKKAAALAGDIVPETGIDLDNIVKMIDGLNYHPPAFKGDRMKVPIIWKNDSQIVALQARKMYSDRPRLEIHVWKWG
jgi:Holliday junction resolvase RusA-like endonuclease